MTRKIRQQTAQHALQIACNALCLLQQYYHFCCVCRYYYCYNNNYYCCCYCCYCCCWFYSHFIFTTHYEQIGHLIVAINNDWHANIIYCYLHHNCCSLSCYWHFPRRFYCLFLVSNLRYYYCYNQYYHSYYCYDYSRILLHSVNFWHRSHYHIVNYLPNCKTDCAIDA